MTAHRGPRRSYGWAVLSGVLAVAGAAFALSCGEDRRPALVVGVDPSSPQVGSSCAVAAEGCACASPGATTACGETESEAGDEVVCLEGRRTCIAGRWGACTGERRIKKYAPAGGGSRVQALADAGAPCGDVCEPSCSVFVDNAVGLDAGAGFTVDDGGITLPGETTGGGACTDIVVAPNAATLTVTRLAPSLLTDPPRVEFSATCGVGGPAIFPTWTLSPADADIARIDPDGALTLQAGVAKTIQVTASTAGASATAPVVVRVDVRRIDPACSAAVTAFDAAPTGGADPGHTLYPYAVPARPVVFPLGLSAPLVQWATGGRAADCVKVSLRYPAGSATPSFLWSAIVAGADDKDPTQGTVDDSQPAVALDQTAWSVFDRTAKGSEGEILVQRRQATAPQAVFSPMPIPVRFANDALRGTVYYTRYTRRLRDDANSGSDNVCGRSGRQTDIDIGAAGFVTSAANGCLGGNCAGSGPTCPVGTCTQVNEAGASLVQALDLSRPGAVPVDPFAGSGSTKCPVCHSVSADGSTFVADTFSGAGVPSIASIGSAANGAASFTPIADAPAYSWVANRDEARGAPQREQSWGFGYAAISPDGRYVLAGPNFWGNTNYNVTLGNGNQQDAGYDAGGKRYFLLDVRGFRQNVDFASSGPLPAHVVDTKWLTASANGALRVDGRDLAQFHRLLLKDEAIVAHNGLYKVEDPGAADRRWVLERLFDADEPGELAFGQKILVEDGETNDGKYFHVAGPSAGTIEPGTTALEFALYTTVMAATSGPLPAYVRSVSSGVTVLTGTGAFPSAAVDAMTIVDRMSILVWNETAANAPYNGIYTLQTGTNWTLTRRPEADRDPEVQSQLRVRVNQGTAYGGRTFVLANSGPVDLDTTALSFELDTNLDEGVKLNQAGLATTLPTMMYPVFAPDGRSLAYVNGDRDPIGGNETGWRRGLSLLSFDASNPTTPFGNKRRLLNNYSAGSPGMVMKWPFFEPDSRSVVVVESAPDDFCPVEAYGGLCSAPNCAATATPVTIDSEIERACFQAASAMGHGNGAPTHRGYWPGRLHSVNTTNSAKAELGWLNDGLASQDAALAPDSGKAYQPTVLPFTAGGYRWVIFTSTRAYGNQMNPLGTHFSCGASLLWMAALDDTVAGAGDRSHPAFLLPGQQIRSIVDPTSNHHYINERGYLVPSPCKTESSVCTVNEECCGAGGATPSSECRLDPDADPPHRTCEAVTACVRQGDSCSTASECCSNVPCVQGVCAAAPVHRRGSFQRTYFGTCPSGYAVRWGNFEWHADAPSSSRILFGAQTSTSEDFTGAELVPFAEANAANVNRPGSPAQSENVHDALLAAEVPSAAYLRVTMDFRPSLDQSVAPVLYDWNQRYDCVAAE